MRAFIRGKRYPDAVWIDLTHPWAYYPDVVPDPGALFAAVRDEVYERIRLEPGSLFWMSAGLQATHKHGIRREPGAGSRISLTFRRIVKDSLVVERRPWGSK